MKWAAAILFVLLAVLFVGCDGGDTYRPVFYPNKLDLTKFTRGPKFETIEEARDWIEGISEGRSGGWDYEIGKNCEESSDPMFKGIEICEETLR